MFKIWWKLVHFQRGYSKKIDGPKFADLRLTICNVRQTDRQTAVAILGKNILGE